MLLKINYNKWNFVQPNSPCRPIFHDLRPWTILKTRDANLFLAVTINKYKAVDMFLMGKYFSENIKRYWKYIFALL